MENRPLALEGDRVLDDSLNVLAYGLEGRLAKERKS